MAKGFMWNARINFFKLSVECVYILLQVKRDKNALKFKVHVIKLPEGLVHIFQRALAEVVGVSITLSLVRVYRFYLRSKKMRMR